MKFVNGATRSVILTSRHAIKLPRLTSWKTFLWGLLANMQEREWSGASLRLCPISFSIPCGLVVVMPRCDPIRATLFSELEYAWDDFRNDQEAGCYLPVELKPDSFGIYKGRVVAVDYGGPYL